MRCSNAGRGIGIRRVLRSLPVILGAVLAAACTSDGAPSGSIFFVTERAAAFLELEDDFSEFYTAVVLSDTHFSAGRELPEAYWQWLDEMSEERRTPRLCLVLGDIANQGLPDEYALYNEFVRNMEVRGIAVYGILGNHDVFESGDYGRNYIAAVAPHAACYVVRTPRLSYYFLDTADGLVGLPQYSALAAQMASDSNPKVVLSHVPLYSPVSSGIWYRMKNAAERARLLSLLAGHDVCLFLCGHLHEHFDYDMGAFQEVIVDSVQEHCSWGF
ncbi:MAG: metallophosphoesterase [Treponemataceae bacterium]|nr:metallophosphoesterase [Treponemataceae bacterium]